MKKLKLLLLPLLSTVILITSVDIVSAGGGLVVLEATPGNKFNVRLSPGEFYTVKATVFTDNTYTTRCIKCPITFKFENPDQYDAATPISTETDTNGQASSHMVSNVLGDRLVYTEVKLPDGTFYTSSSYVLGYNQPSFDYSAPVMVYPQDQQVLDLEGAYMFKVKPVLGASGYLFGLFQNGEMVYENYRDSKTLSSNGEFALWEDNSAHARFKEGYVKVMIRALIDNKWSEAREITIYLKPRGSSTNTIEFPTVTPTTIVVGATPSATPSVVPLQPAKDVVIIHDSTASAELQLKILELEKKLDESQQKQIETENRLTQLINWIKSIFPFFR